MEYLKPLQTIADFQDAMRAARVVYNHSLAKMVPRKKTIKKSKKMAFLSAISTSKSNSSRMPEPVTKKKSSVRQFQSFSSESKGTVNESECSSRESKERHIQIFVLNPVKAICLQLHPSTSISELKGLLQDQLGIVPAKQHLVTRKGVELHDALLLKNYGIEQETNLELRIVTGLMGGMQNAELPETPDEVQQTKEGKKDNKATGSVLKKLKKRLTLKGKRRKCGQKPQLQDDPRTQNASAERDVTHETPSTPSDGEKQEDACNMDLTNSQGATSIPHITWSSTGEATCPCTCSASAERQLDKSVQSSSTSSAAGAIPKKRPNPGNTDFSNSQGATISPHTTGSSTGEHVCITQSASAERQLDNSVQSPSTSFAKGAIPKKRPTPGSKDFNSNQGATNSPHTTDRKLQSQDEPILQSTSAKRKDGLVASSSGDTYIVAHDSAFIFGNCENNSFQFGLPGKMKVTNKGEEDSDLTKLVLKLLLRDKKPTELIELLKSYDSELGEFTSGSIKFIFHVRSREGLDKLWSSFTSGELARKLTKILITDELTTQDKSDLAITVSIQENDYKRGCRFFEDLQNAKRKEILNTRISKQETNDEETTEVEHLTLKLLMHGETLVEGKSPDEHNMEVDLNEPESVKFMFHVRSREGLEKLWTSFFSGELAKKLTEILITDELTTEDKSDLAIRVSIQENEYKQGCRFFDDLQNAKQKGQVADPIQVAADMTETALKTRYMTTANFVQVIPWIEDDKMHIMDIYTKLILVKSDGQLRKKGTGTKLKSYEDIFIFKTREGHLIKRAILDGSVGLGKTTLFDKMSYDWAEGSSETLKKYKLVFVLKMHALEQTSDLMDAIFNQLLEEKIVDQSDLELFINGNPDKVLILLDGFNEFKTTTLSETQYGSIPRILNQKKGTECFVFVTSRPSHFHKLVTKSMVEKPYTHVTVQGFADEDIKQYVKRFYSDEHDKAEELIHRIYSSDVLCDLAKSPMLLCLMCLLWRENSELPNTMSHLYSTALRYIFNRKARDMSPDEISKIVIEIGKVALHGLISPGDQLLSFKESDFDKPVLDTALRAGVLTSQSVLKGLDTHHSVHFIHKSILWYCAAMYWQSLVEKDSGNFKEILDQIGSNNDFSGYEYLLRFCCGDSEACTNQIVQMLQKHPVQRLVLNCYFESQSKSLLSSVDVINSVITDKISIERWNNDCLNSFIYFLKHVNDQKKGRGNAYLAKVQKLKIRSSNLQRLSANLTHAISGMTNLSILRLVDCSLTPNNIEHIASSFASTTLTELDLEGNIALGGSASLWAPHLQQMKHLKKLHLTSCSLTGGDMNHIVVSVGDMPILVELDLSLNKALGACAISWSPHLKQMKHLQKLDLNDCSLTGGDMKHIAVSVGDMPILIELDLSLNKALGASAISWFLHVKQMKHLQKLRMDNCYLDGQDFKYLALSVGHMNKLVCCLVSDNRNLVEQTSTGIKLDLNLCSLTGTDLVGIVQSMSNRNDLMKLVLSENYGLSGSAALWSPHLKQMKNLQKLDLSDCSLTCEDLKHIAVSMSDMPTLVDLDLSWNTALGGSAISWSPHLKQMKHLQELNLRDCSLTCEDMKHIAVSMSDMTILVELDLSENEALGGSVQSRYPHLKKMKHAQELDLSHCSLKGKDMKHIAVSLSDVTTLIELNLSGNNALGGSAISWSSHLKQMKRLQKLDLSNCSLKGKDMKHIAVSMSDLHTPVTLNLSENESLGGFAVSWSLHLKQMKHLQKLDLSNCSLKGNDLKHIAVSLSDMTTLVELDLSRNNALGGSAVSWSPHLKQMKCLQKLRMDNCNLDGQDFKYLASSVGHMSKLMCCLVSDDRNLVEQTSAGIKLDLNWCSLTGTELVGIVEEMSNRNDLVELILSSNDGLGGSAALWSPHLKKMKNLQKVDLSNCSLTGKDMKYIAVSLGDIPTLVALNLARNKVSGCSAISWSPLLKQMKHLQKLDLRDYVLTIEDVKNIAVSLSYITTLVELNLWNEALGGSAVSWSPLFKQMKHLQKLDIRDCLLTVEDVKHIAVSLSDMPSLGELDLSRNEALGCSAISWAPHLKQMKHLQKLNLTNCSLTDEDMKYITVSVSAMPTLVKLNLSGNEALGGSAISWSPHLKQMKRLQKLNLTNCSLTDKDMKYITVSVSAMPTLVQLNLSGNEALGGSAISWSPHLKQTKHLQKLRMDNCNLDIPDLKYLASSVGHMCNLVFCSVEDEWDLIEQTSAGIKLDLIRCSLTGTDLVGIVEAISNRSDLVELILSENDRLGGSAVLWSPHLKKMKHLQKLDLNNCELTGEDMKHIAVSLSDMTTLVGLGLLGNEALGCSAISWSPHLKQVKHLQKLDLRDCALTDKGIEHIAVSLTDVSTLVELDLSWNKALGGSAIKWSPYLKQMKHLQKLLLSWCSLTDEDMKHIAVSLSDMPNLVELDLSWNEDLGGSAISWS